MAAKGGASLAVLQNKSLCGACKGTGGGNKGIYDSVFVLLGKTFFLKVIKVGLAKVDNNSIIGNNHII